MQLGNVFAEMYDRLAARSPSSEAIARWISLVASDAGAMRNRVRALRDADPAAAAPLFDGVDDAELFTRLVAIERACATIDRLGGGAETVGRLGALRRHWARTARLNDDDNGAVIFRRAYPARPSGTPEGLANVFTTLIRVSAHDWSRVRMFVLPAIHDLDRKEPRAVVAELTRPEDAPEEDETPAAEGIDVVAVPFLRSRTDLEVKRSKRAEVEWYSFQPASEPADGSTWTERARAALDQLVTNDAELGLCPESSLNDRVLESWLEALGRSDHRRRAWQLLGSGPVTGEALARGSHLGAAFTAAVGRPGVGLAVRPNRALLVDVRSSELLLWQDKRARFDIEPDTWVRYGLPGARPARTLAEDMDDSDRSWNLLDTPRGRLGILICEDLSRVLEMGAMILNLGVSLVLVPVVAPPLENSHWQANAGGEDALSTGAVVLVANSWAVSDSAPEAHLLTIARRDGGSGPPDGYTVRAVLADAPTHFDGSSRVRAPGVGR